MIRKAGGNFAALEAFEFNNIIRKKTSIEPGAILDRTLAATQERVGGKAAELLGLVYCVLKSGFSASAKA